METDETLKTTLIQEAEAEIVKLLTRVQELQEGDLRGAEQQVLTSVFALGRTMLEPERCSGLSRDVSAPSLLGESTLTSQ